MLNLRVRWCGIKSELPKIVHLSTSRSGGAGIAAHRLHQGLRQLEVNSLYFTLYRNDTHYNQSDITLKRNYISRLVPALYSWLNRILSKKTYFTIISAGPLNSEKLFEFGKPSEVVFHVHNWFNFISFREIEIALERGYKFVFTLHDQRLFTGGCHYSLDCLNFNSKCSKCPLLPAVISFIPSKNLGASVDLFSKFRDQIEIIAPSRWIFKQALCSSILKRNSISFIPNWHGDFALSDLKHVSSKASKATKLVLGVASKDKRSNIKGLDTIFALESLINSVAADIEIIYLADFQVSDKQPQLFWQEIDYLLVPSILDNSPNVIHEAKILGIPVIATDVGGIGELLNEEYDYLVDSNENTPRLIWDIIQTVTKPLSNSQKTKISLDYKDFVAQSVENHIEVYRKIAG